MTDGSIPLRWGINGPIIGHAIMGDNGLVNGVITTKEYTEKLTPKVDDFSIFDARTIKPIERQELMATPNEANKTITAYEDLELRKHALNKAIESEERYSRAGDNADRIVKIAGKFEKYLREGFTEPKTEVGHTVDTPKV